MNVTIIGAGHVGLVSAVCLASKGHQVVCVEKSQRILDLIKNGKVPLFVESGLQKLLSKVLAAQNLRVTSRLADGLEHSSLALVAVGTPTTQGSIDLTAMRVVIREIASYLKQSKHFISVVIKSTVPPGTTDTWVRKLLESESGLVLGEFGLGMNPEFLREGNAVEDFMNPDRVVMGCEDQRTRQILEEVYGPWKGRLIFTNSRTAEMIKYASNFLLAAQISLANELANLTSEIGGIDIDEVIEGIHLDRRWNPILPSGKRAYPEILTYLIPGCGFGGSCLPKDVEALYHEGVMRGLPMRICRSVLDVNHDQPLEVIRSLKKVVPEIKGLSILILGLAFKPNTDDVRESVSLKIIDELVKLGAKIFAHDPMAISNAQNQMEDQDVTFINRWQDQLGNVQVIVVLTKWPEYRDLLKRDSADVLRDKIIVDPRHFFSSKDLLGCTYVTTGSVRICEGVESVNT